MGSILVVISSIIASHVAGTICIITFRNVIKAVIRIGILASFAGLRSPLIFILTVFIVNLSVAITTTQSSID